MAAPSGDRPGVPAVKGGGPGPLEEGRRREGRKKGSGPAGSRDAIRSAIRAGKGCWLYLNSAPTQARLARPARPGQHRRPTPGEATMRAIRIHQTGGPEVLRLEEVELPAPGKGEVRLRQHAIGVNFIDTYFRAGFYPAPNLPFTPGSEGAGEVVEVGPAVVDFKPGDRVAYVGAIGAYAEERNIDAKFLLKLPRAISYETAPALMLTGLTA